MSADNNATQNNGEIWSEAEENLASLIQDAYELLKKSQPEKRQPLASNSADLGTNDNVKAAKALEQVAPITADIEEVNNSLELETSLDNLNLESSAQTYDLSTSEGKNAFTKACLELLVKIQDAISDFVLKKEQTVSSDEPPDVLGIRDLKVIHTLLEVIVIWGIYPCLQDGVGVSLSKRVRSGFVQSEFFDRESSPGLQLKEKNARLLEILRTLCSISRCSSVTSRYTSVSSIIMNRHLTDMYAGLLQLAFGPLTQKNMLPKVESSLNDGPKAQVTTGASLQRPVDLVNILSANSAKKTGIHILTPSEREDCIAQFDDLFKRADAFKSLESLTLLLGSPLYPSPRWLSNICGRYLTRILLKPNGVKVVMSFMLDEVEEVSLPQLERVAKLVLSVPHQVSSLQEYYKVIIPQLLSLIEHKFAGRKEGDLSESSNIVRAASFTLSQLIRKQPKLAYRLFVGELMRPITSWWSNQTETLTEAEQNMNKLFENDEDIIFSSEDSIELTIATVHRLLVGNEPSPILFHCILSDAITPLYYLYEFAHTNKSVMKDRILEILQVYFRIMEVEKGLENLKSIVYRKRFGLKLMTVHRGYTYFTSGPTNGIVLARTSKPKEIDLNTELFVEFLNSMNNVELNGDFFVWALTEYSSAQSDSSISNPRQTLVILHLILVMTESLGHTILKKSTQIIAFANSVLEKESEPEPGNLHKNSKFEFVSNIVEEAEDSEQDQDEIEYLALSLLGAVLTDNKELSAQDLILLDHTQSLLGRFSNHINSETRDIANNLKLIIATRIACNLSQESTDEDKLATSKKRYQQAMEALQDHILPVKAYGIGILKDMILKKDPLLVGPELDRVLDIFISMVQNEDSFIYLNAIKGLSAMTDIHGKKILTKLLAIYEDQVNQPMDNRLRVGEALLQTVERAGEVLGKFADILLGSLLRVLRSRESPHLQNSALAIIGVMCETCPYALLPWFREIIEWMVTLLKLEKSVEVRRAAVVLFVSLFRGMGTKAIYDVPSDLVKDMLHTLRFVEATEQDELTKYNARIGLSDLDAIMKSEIFHT